MPALLVWGGDRATVEPDCPAGAELRGAGVSAAW